MTKNKTPLQIMEGQITATERRMNSLRSKLEIKVGGPELRAVRRKIESREEAVAKYSTELIELRERESQIMAEAQASPKVDRDLIEKELAAMDKTLRQYQKAVEVLSE